MDSSSSPTPASTLTFDSAQILQTIVRDAQDQQVEYNVQTTTANGRGVDKKRWMTFVEVEGVATAAIDWREKTFEISGTRCALSKMRRKRSAFASSRYWTWFDCEEYKVKYEAEAVNTWTVYSYTGSVLATFSASTSRLFRGKTNPILTLSSSVSDEEERQFILLVLLYSETRRMEGLKKERGRRLVDLLNKGGP
ncbi:unnamed protein product [Mycena citricolor]|uniref:Uncharacterized protein n=1 Tax=Mycena citricolor TaxID=2018698 RepID=A0AAD2HD05_9AGAR|nr:unnamed protein product [Mycena citricolor]CAK5282492.1 unnamed protein product [Mycena citricolor]